MVQTGDGKSLRQAMLEAIRGVSENGKRSFDPAFITRELIHPMFHPLTREIKDAVLTMWNDLVRGGQLNIGVDNGHWSPQHMSVTEAGRKTLDHADRDPINEAGYVKNLDAETSLDEITKGYVAEALRTYRACCYKATAVLIGAALENLILGLRDALSARARSTDRRWRERLDGWKIKQVTEAISERVLIDLELDSRKNPSDANLRRLRDDAECRLMPIAAEFRKLRNEAGHPANLDPIEATDVHANLLLFPNAARLLCRLKDWVVAYYV